jgi:hypothetical protein
MPLFAEKCCSVESSVCEVTMPIGVKGPLLVFSISCVVQIPASKVITWCKLVSQVCWKLKLKASDKCLIFFNLPSMEIHLVERL